MRKRILTDSKLVDADGLSKRIGFPPRTILSWASSGKISVIDLGYRTKLFDPDTVLEDLKRFERKAVA